MLASRQVRDGARQLEDAGNSEGVPQKARALIWSQAGAGLEAPASMAAFTSPRPASSNPQIVRTSVGPISALQESDVSAKRCRWVSLASDPQGRPPRPSPDRLRALPQPLVGQFLVRLAEPASTRGTSMRDFEAFL